ncbi:unnamed protein product, partial [marine sediment metagenome]
MRPDLKYPVTTRLTDREIYSMFNELRVTQVDLNAKNYFDCIDYIKQFSKIVVVGNHRSGTTFASKAIA